VGHTWKIAAHLLHTLQSAALLTKGGALGKVRHTWQSAAQSAKCSTLGSVAHFAKCGTLGKLPHFAKCAALDRVLLSLVFKTQALFIPTRKACKQNYHITFILCSQNTFSHCAF